VKLTLLGSGGWIPSPRRETCSALLRADGATVLFDAGTGVSRLLEHPDLLAGVEQLEIVLTHFHLDHVVGLGYLPALTPAKRVWAPGRWLYDCDSTEILERLLDPPLFPVPLVDLVESVEEIGEGGLDLGGVGMEVRAQQRHSDPTMALRVGEALAYCTDTAYDEANARFAAGVELLVHEAWHASASTEDETHTAAGEAGRLADEAGAAELVMVHIDPRETDDEALATPAREVFTRTAVGEDLLERTLG